MDQVYASFLAEQHAQVARLTATSDIVEVVALDPQHFRIRLRCRVLVRDAAGALAETDAVELGLWLPDDYLRRVDPARLLLILGPRDVFHPNVRDPFVCIGAVAPGTPLVDLIYRVFELITWQAATVDERDALNPEACQLARNFPERFPLERRPLKQRASAPHEAAR